GARLTRVLGPRPMAILPVRTTSWTPMGRSSSISASTLPSSPVASSTNDTGVTSMTRARKMSVLRLGVDADEDQLPLDVAVVGQVVDLDHVDQLVELLHHLLDHELVAADHDGHAGDAGVQRLAHRQALDVVAARREEPGHPREHAELVLHEHRDRVLARLAAVAGHLEPRLRLLRLLARFTGRRGQ